MARAVASAVTTGRSDGALLLLDEPFAGLDIGCGMSLRCELRSGWRDGRLRCSR